jgi:hypothetical protein
MQHVNAADDPHHSDRRDDTARPSPLTLHRWVYVATVGCVVWFALAVWGFAGGGITDYLLVIVSGFMFVVLALILILSRVGATNSGAAESGGGLKSFHDWAAKDFDTSQERLSGMEAATLILLPIAAAAIGMTVFAIVFHLAEHAT